MGQPVTLKPFLHNKSGYREMLGYPSNSDTFQMGHFSNWKLQRGQWESWSPCELIFVCKFDRVYGR